MDPSECVSVHCSVLSVGVSYRGAGWSLSDLSH